MIIGKIQQVIIIKVYDENGNYLSEKAEYIYKPILLWRDLALGLFVAFIIATQAF